MKDISDLSKTQLGLRIDVDTLKGTLEGVPRLLDTLNRYGVKGSFFMSVGPDNMGRHLWRMFRPAFLRKMLRSKAGSLYGWSILLSGTCWPGVKIGPRSGDIIRRIDAEGHEVGLHAWDHHRWQQKVANMSESEVASQLRRAHKMLEIILGRPPECSAVPAWRCTEAALVAKSQYAYRYNSDCRGDSPFYPCVDGQPLTQLQMPVNLPTYDEVVGSEGVDDFNFNEYLLGQIRPGAYNVLTIHAEVEGGSRAALFEDFMERARERHLEIISLGKLAQNWESAPHDSLIEGRIPGREGWASYKGGGGLQ